MRKFNKIILTTVIVGLLSYCCTNEDGLLMNTEHVPGFLIEDAKNWHYEHTHELGLFSGRLSNDQKLILTPKFKEAKIKTLKDGRKFLYTPAMDFDLKNKDIAFLRALCFLCATIKY
jgi:hypothetical protein